MFMFKVSDHSDFENIGCFVFPGQLFFYCVLCLDMTAPAPHQPLHSAHAHEAFGTRDGDCQLMER